MNLKGGYAKSDLQPYIENEKINVRETHHLNTNYGTGKRGSVSVHFYIRFNIKLFFPVLVALKVQSDMRIYLSLLDNTELPVVEEVGGWVRDDLSEVHRSKHRR